MNRFWNRFLVSCFIAVRNGFPTDHDQRPFGGGRKQGQRNPGRGWPGQWNSNGLVKEGWVGFLHRHQIHKWHDLELEVIFHLTGQLYSHVCRVWEMFCCCKMCTDTELKVTFNIVYLQFLKWNDENIPVNHACHRLVDWRKRFPTYIW